MRTDRGTTARRVGSGKCSRTTSAPRAARRVRPVFEALALSYQRVWAEMTGAGAAPERVIASGRVTTDHPTWLQLLCDALDTPVIPLEMKRATLRGTTLIALEIIDPGGTRATPPLGEPLEPRYAEHYVAARRTFDELYATLIGADSTS